MKRLFSGEIFFALFLLSGLFKKSIEFLPFDLAALFLILTFLSIVKRTYKNPAIHKVSVMPLVIFMSFTALIFISFFYSPNIELTQDKTIKFILLTTPAFVFPFFLLRTKESLIKFLITLAFISTVMALFSLPMIFERGGSLGFVGFNDGNYLGLARASGLGISILLFLGLLNDRFKRYRILFLLSIVAVLISLIASGARMPLIAVAIAFLMLIVSSIKIKNGFIKYPKYYNKIVGLVILLLIPLFWAYNQGYFNSIIFRFETLLQTNNSGASVSARTDRYMSAIDIWKENFLFGAGFGSFGDFYNSDVALDYPHNLFLEVISELGLVGLLVIIALFFVAFTRFLNLAKLKGIRSQNLFITVIITFLIIFINAMVSGDINGNRILFTFISIICLLPLIFRKEINEIKLEQDHTQ